MLYVTTFCMQHCAVACFVLKQRCSTNRCQCQKGGLTCIKLCACSDDDEPREKALQEDDGDEYVDDNEIFKEGFNPLKSVTSNTIILQFIKKSVVTILIKGLRKVQYGDIGLLSV